MPVIAASPHRYPQEEEKQQRRRRDVSAQPFWQRGAGKVSRILLDLHSASWLHVSMTSRQDGGGSWIAVHAGRNARRTEVHGWSPRSQRQNNSARRKRSWSGA